MEETQEKGELVMQAAIVIEYQSLKHEISSFCEGKYHVLFLFVTPLPPSPHPAPAIHPHQVSSGVL